MAVKPNVEEKGKALHSIYNNCNSCPVISILFPFISPLDHFRFKYNAPITFGIYICNFYVLHENNVISINL